jgi:hypothetical protein
MSLANIFLEMKRRATQTGEERATDLRGGARLAVRVQAGVVTLTISRKAKKVGSTELEVFKRDCGVPSAAIRFPQEGQNTRTVEDVLYYYIAYRWRESEAI